MDLQFEEGQIADLAEGDGLGLLIVVRYVLGGKFIHLLQGCRRLVPSKQAVARLVLVCVG